MLKVICRLLSEFGIGESLLQFPITKKSIAVQIAQCVQRPRWIENEFSLLIPRISS